MSVLFLVLVCPLAVTCQSTMETSGRSTTTATPKLDAMLGRDYDYVDTGVSYRQRVPWASPKPNLGGEPTMGEKYEWLVGRLRYVKQRGTLGQLEELQKLFPNINVTHVYDSLRPLPRAGAEEDEREGRAGGHGNSTRYKEEEDEMEGHWVNGTLRPGEGPEMDDAYYYNGTWHPGVREAEDGHYVNGTWHPAPGEADEEGYMLNGTWHEENEVEEGQGQEEENEKEEKLMWWQLHHPKWRDGGANEAAHGEKAAENEQQQQQQQDRKSGIPIPIAAPMHLPKHPARHQNPHSQRNGHHAIQHYQRPQSLPQYQRPQSQQQFQRPPNWQARGDNTGPRVIENQPIQSKMTGDKSSNPLISSAGEPQSVAGSAAQQQQQHQLPETSVIKTTSRKDNGMSSSMTWGIVIACVIAFTFILAPLACILYKYRQEKRIKKRTFLKRPEHGSVDEGIMDAMVMSELGEVRNSRVKSVVGRKPGPRQAAAARGDVRSSRGQNSRRSSATSLSLSRLRSERKPLSTVELGDGPEILIV